MRFKSLLFSSLALIGSTTLTKAQMNWGNALMYWGENKTLTNIAFSGSPTVKISDERTITVKDVTTHSHSLTKLGDGTLAIDSVNPLWDGDIVYGSKTDSIVLLGAIGAYVNDSIGYRYVGNIKGSLDSLCLFVIAQNDTTKQTFMTANYVNSDSMRFDVRSNSYARFEKSSRVLAAHINLYSQGTVYVEGLKNLGGVMAAVSGGRIITGDSIPVNGLPDVAFFDKQRNGFGNDAIVLAESAVLQAGVYGGPSLIRADGNIKHDGILEIDVYNPNQNYGLTQNAETPAWNVNKPFSDKVQIDSGQYVFDDHAQIKLAFNDMTAIQNYLTDSTEYYLPVIMFRYADNAYPSSSTIVDKQKVNVSQTLPGWRLSFIEGNGTANTVTGWGYVYFKRVLMTKDASLNNEPVNNGSYPNPVAVLFRDTIEYTVKGINAGTSAGMLVIRDTLPAYMEYAPNTHTESITAQSFNHTQPTKGGVTYDALEWIFDGVAADQTVTVTYKATPAAGACASQALFVNVALVSYPNNATSITAKTNATYHQGAGVAVVTFSAAVGGFVFGATPQAVDFSTTVSRNVGVVAEDGYNFAGWSHDEYYSMKGELVPAAQGIMSLDTLTIYGNVELRAEFEMAEEEDHSATDNEQVVEKKQKNRVWANGNTLFIQSVKPGSTARILTTDGVTVRILTLHDTSVNNVTLKSGVYFVTIDDNPGHKIVIK